jgi:hypothetical protein
MGIVVFGRHGVWLQCFSREPDCTAVLLGRAWLVASMRNDHFCPRFSSAVISMSTEGVSEGLSFACGRNLFYIRYMTDLEFRRLSPSNRLGPL